MNHPVVWTIVIIVVAFVIYLIINMQNQPQPQNVKAVKKTNPVVIKQSSEIDVASAAYSDVAEQSFSPPVVDLTPLQTFATSVPAAVPNYIPRGPNYIPRSGRNGRNYHEIPNPKYFKPNIVTLNINNRYEQSEISQ